MPQLRPLAHRNQQYRSSDRDNPSLPHTLSPSTHRSQISTTPVTRQGPSPVPSTMQHTNQTNPAPASSTGTPGQQSQLPNVTNIELLTLVQELQREMSSLRKNIAQKDQALHDLQTAIDSKNKTIQELEQKIALP